MFQDILRESWVYQEIGEEFLERGYEKGLEKGREEERKQELQRQRQMLLSLIHAHFPEIAGSAKQQVENINNLELLYSLNLKMIVTQELDEARKLLFEAGKQ